MTTEEIRQGLQRCLIDRECMKCPYYKYFYEDDIDYIGQNSCWGRLYRDADSALNTLEKEE